jgi:DNA-binding transcriptional ArsR family regulator
MEITTAVKALAALAQKSRLEIFRLLVKTGPEGLAAGDVAEQLDAPPATISFHLKELVNAGLIERRRESRSIIYSLKCSGMRDLLEFLSEDCCQGRAELCSPDYRGNDCGKDCQPIKKRGVRARTPAK